MIYLIDNQLPVGLVEHLKAHGLESVHVFHCGLDQSSDHEIWKYAKAHDCVIVSKDEDFIHLSLSDSNGPPVVWVRLGNCRNNVLFAAFDSVLANVLDAIEAGSKIVEIQ